MTGTPTQKNGKPDPKPSKDGPPATRSTDQQVRTKVEAIAALRAAKIINTTADITSLTTLAEALLKHALTLHKPGQQTLQAQNDKKTMEAIAILIQHYNEGNTADLVQDYVREALDTAKEQLQQTMREELGKMRQEAAAASTSVADMAKQVHNSLNKVAEAAPSYSKAAAGGAGATSPAFIARQAIHARQILFRIEKADGFAGKDKDHTTIKDTLQKTLANMGAPEDVRVRMVNKNEKRGDLLVEMATETAADWLRAEGRMETMEKVMGTSLRSRTYQVMVKFVPIEFDPEKEQAEVLAENGIDKSAIAHMRWIKPHERRKQGQRFAHLMFTFNEAKAANEAIMHGVTIRDRRRAAEKCKKEALRCLKCQKYNHMAKDCTASKETCGTCATEGHATRECQTTDKPKCATCGAAGHAAWDRSCPMFVKRNADLDKRIPENALPYFPTHEAWTWLSSHPTNFRPQTTGADDIEIRMKAKTQKAAKQARKGGGGNKETAAEGGETEEDLFDKIDKAANAIDFSQPMQGVTRYEDMFGPL